MRAVLFCSLNGKRVKMSNFSKGLTQVRHSHTDIKSWETLTVCRFGAFLGIKMVECKLCYRFLKTHICQRVSSHSMSAPEILASLYNM